MATILKNIRQMSGKTQKELASQLDISRAYFGLVEAGRLIPTTGVAKKLEHMFDMPVEELLSCVEEKRLTWKPVIKN